MNDKLKNLIFLLLFGFCGLLVMLGQYISVQNASDARADAAYMRGFVDAKLQEQDKDIEDLSDRVAVLDIRKAKIEAKLDAHLEGHQ